MQQALIYEVTILQALNVVVAAAGGVAVLQKRVATGGASKLVGTLHCNGGTPAVGFPRVVQYANQSTATGPSLITTLPQDVSQPGTSYPINVDLSLPYVGVEYTEDGAGPGCTILQANATLK